MVNIKEVAEYVAANNDISKAAAERMVKDAFAYIAASVSEGDEVSIDKFGKFVPQENPERQCRNPKTGEAMTAPAKKVVKFRPALAFKEMVANG